jgi:hypothetical protein
MQNTFTNINVSKTEKRPYTVHGKRIWALSQADAEWQYQQMEKQLSKMRR